MIVIEGLEGFDLDDLTVKVEEAMVRKSEKKGMSDTVYYQCGGGCTRIMRVPI